MPKAAARARRRGAPMDQTALDKQLLEAVHARDVHAVRRLLAQGANVRTVDQNKDEPLHCAVTSQEPSAELVDVLLAHGADINALGYGFPPLQYASNLGNLPMVKHLVAHGADVNGVNEEGQTALHAAAEYGSMDVYEYLLTLGLRADQMDRDGRTPQDYLDALDDDEDDEDNGSGDDEADPLPPPPVALVSLTAGRRATRQILDRLGASLLARGGRGSDRVGGDAADDLKLALTALRGAVASARQRPHKAELAADAAMALAALVAHADVSPTAAVALGTTAVALLETYSSSAGASALPVWETLGRAVARPLRSLLAPVHAYAQAIRALPASTAKSAVRLFGHTAATREASAIRSAHPDGVAALKTLDKLAPVVVAAWSRQPELLCQYQGSFAGGVRDLGFHAGDGIYWLSTLLSTTFALPVVVLVPELEEAYVLVAEAVVQMAQLCILLGAVLAEPLRRLGAHPQSFRPAASALAAPDGGPQPCIDVRVPFHIFPWQAMDPHTRRPALLRHMWTAPAGRGGHSLPSDFLVGDLTRINGHAVVLLVGPRSPELTQGLVRWLTTDRPFPALPARVTGVRQLAEAEAAEWFNTVAAMAPAARVAPTERDLLVFGNMVAAASGP